VAETEEAEAEGEDAEVIEAKVLTVALLRPITRVGCI